MVSQGCVTGNELTASGGTWAPRGKQAFTTVRYRSLASLASKAGRQQTGRQCPCFDAKKNDDRREKVLSQWVAMDSFLTLFLPVAMAFRRYAVLLLLKSIAGA